jgi:hypothetical protein
VPAAAVAIGHAGDVLADDEVGGAGGCLIAKVFGEAVRVGEEVVEEFADHLNGTVAFGVKGFGKVDAVAEEAFEFETGLTRVGPEAGEALGVAADIVDILDACVAAGGDGAFDETGDEEIDELAERFVELDAGRGSGIHGLGGIEEIVPGGDGFAEFGEGEEAGLQGVVEIRGRVGDFVGEVD